MEHDGTWWNMDALIARSVAHVVPSTGWWMTAPGGGTFRDAWAEAPWEAERRCCLVCIMSVRCSRIGLKDLKGKTPEEQAAFRMETLILKVKLSRSWLAVVGVYRPPSIPKHERTRELSSIFEEVSTLTETVFYAGDFNADLLNPDKPPKDGVNLLDLMEIFALDCLITKATPTNENIRRTI